jgi:hypothetical protein
MFNLCIYVNRLNKGVAVIYTQTLHYGRFYCKLRIPATFQ